MKFALLGWNPTLCPLLRSITADERHSFTIAAEVPRHAHAELLAAAPGLRIRESWEELLVDTAADVTLVAGDTDSVQAGAKQLASDGRSLALYPQASQGSAFIYELTLIHDDNRVILIPVPRLAVHPFVQKLQDAVERGELGKVVLQRIERFISGDAQQSGLARDQVDATLFDDVPLLRFLGGNYSRITAVHSGSEELGITQATVTLSGSHLAESSWTARAGKPRWKLEVTGSSGAAVLELNSESEDSLTISSATSKEPQISKGDGSEIGEKQLAAIETALEDSAAHWAEMTRAFETVEATHTSLRRRRTIDLFFETTSERSIFKSQMTAVGCGLVMLTLFGLVAFLLLGAFVDSNSRMQRNAEADNRVIRSTEFVAGTSQLNEAGLKHVSEISREVQQSAETVFVMPESGQSDGGLNEDRIEAVVAVLSESGHPDGAAFVKIASVPHPATQLLLKVLRILWIAPLVLFLLLQSLLFVTRPSSHEAQAESDPAE